MTVPRKQPGQIRGFQRDANTCHMYECDGGCGGLRRSRRPHAVVVDDDVEVEVRLQEGPCGAVAGSRLEASRGSDGLWSFTEASKLPFKLRPFNSLSSNCLLTFTIVSWIFNIKSFLGSKMRFSYLQISQRSFSLRAAHWQESPRNNTLQEDSQQVGDLPKPVVTWTIWKKKKGKTWQRKLCLFRLSFIMRPAGRFLWSLLLF